jgi:hypothetical protein
LILFLFLLLTVPALNFVLPASAQEFFVTSRSSSMEPVDIMLDGKVHLRIPKAYLVRVKNWFGGDQDAVYMEALLPDLRPLKPGEIRTIDTKLLVNIWLNDPFNEKSQEHWFSKIKKMKPYVTPIDSDFSKVSDSYFAADKKSIVLFPYEDSYIFAKKPYFAIIRCEKKGEYVKCRATKNFSGKVIGTYSFSKDLMPEKWRETDSKVSELIDKFVVRENGDSK